jgi:hypothetical protein
MTIKRRTALLVLILFILGCGLVLIVAWLGSWALETQVGPELPGIHWLREDIELPMDVGSSCWTNNAGTICRDAFRVPRYPAEEHILANSNTLELFFDEPIPHIVEVQLRPISNPETSSDNVEIEFERANGRVFVTVPENLSGNYTLLVDARWTNKGGNRGHGDAWYTIPVRFSQ